MYSMKIVNTANLLCKVPMVHVVCIICVYILYIYCMMRKSQFQVRYGMFIILYELSYPFSMWFHVFSCKIQWAQPDSCERLLHRVVGHCCLLLQPYYHGWRKCRKHTKNHETTSEHVEIIQNLESTFWYIYVNTFNLTGFWIVRCGISIVNGKSVKVYLLANGDTSYISETSHWFTFGSNTASCSSMEAFSLMVVSNKLCASSTWTQVPNLKSDHMML